MKKIGIVASKHVNTIGVSYPYWSFASKLGEIVMINPLDHTIRADLDLLILPGGADIDATTYGEVPGVYTNKANTFLEYFDANILPDYLALNEAGLLPVYAVCRGFQLINTKFGGQLTQHHITTLSNPRSKLVETIINHTEEELFTVNSLHHQSVFPNQLAKGFNILGISKEFGNVEIMQHSTLDILAVQFHPEDMDGTGGEYAVLEKLKTFMNVKIEEGH